MIYSLKLILSFAVRFLAPGLFDQLFHALCRRRQNLLQGAIDLQIGRPSQRTDRFDDRGEDPLFDEGGLNGEKGFLLELMQDKTTHVQQ